MIGPKAIKDLSPSERERVVGRSRPDIESVKSTVARIVDDVRGRGDAAVIEYTARLDGIRLEPHQLLVGKEEIKAARQSVPRAVVRALERSVRNVRRFHEAQLRPGEWMIEVERGVRVGRARRPIASVGLYVPGGRAAYPSTVVMLAVPARVAGVERTVMCTPPARDGSVNPATLVAADLAGVDAIYRIGGAQAIAAMAFGTETVEKVDKIVGPGNIYVAAAKSLVYGYVDTDLPAGPSEVL
ncbi:TPA: histidinol dehydrogenase, partial [Candidatus Bathyarchaeota archaeon]|nr:histidinol dehydrogenase [Candidatus Bathyarchaeota archaeon]